MRLFLKCKSHAMHYCNVPNKTIRFLMSVIPRLDRGIQKDPVRKTNKYWILRSSRRMTKSPRVIYGTAHYILCAALLLFTVHCSLFTAHAEENPLNVLRDSALSYFKPLKGKIISVSDGAAAADTGDKSQVKKGMRFTVFREGAPFLHPVTKEPIGKVETLVGKAEVKEAGPDTTALAILSGEVKEADLIRISETKVRMLFYQHRNIDWSLADSYYRTLKDSGRFELIDTSLDTDNDADVIAEAKKLNADVVLILSAKAAGNEAALKQSMFWTEDSVKFAEDEVKIASAFMKEVKFGEDLLPRQKSDSNVFLDLSFGARFISSGDINADGKAELLLSTGKDIRFYMPSGEISTVYEIEGATLDDHLYLDVIDMNKNGRDEILITFLNDNKLTSRIYELKDDKFSVLWEGNVFLRRLGNDLIAQGYDSGEGYYGKIYTIVFDGEYKKGSEITFPQNVNIYDFVYITEPDGKRYVLAYDEAGYLNLYDEAGRIWRSAEDYGGFITTFKKIAPDAIVDKGEWSVKDRIMAQGREVFVIKRIPLVGIVKGLGYGKSQIKSLWWTGASLEERTVVESVAGNILDYTLSGDNLIVLNKPILGIKFLNILKGESPLGSLLYLYSLKVR